MKDGLQYFSDTHLPLIGFMIFFIVFLLMLFLQARQYSASTVEKLSSFPLHDADLAGGSQNERN
jgi:hypothetical protein